MHNCELLIVKHQEEKSPVVNFSDRLRQILEDRGLKQNEAARMAGVTPSSITHWLRGQRQPGAEELAKLASSLGMSMDSLFIGEPKADSDLQPRPKNFGGPFYGTSDEAPVIARASAGELHRWEDMGHDVPRIKTSCRDPNCYAVQVDGDSMEPMYSEGDILVVAPNLEPMVNDLVIAKTVEDDVLFKIWLGERKGKFRLQSYNPKYPVMEFTRGELRKIHPIHSVVRLLKEKILV